MKPSVSRNHLMVSWKRDVISTPWPMRLTCEGPLGRRISSPARDSGLSPVLRCRREPVHDLDLVAVRLGQAQALAAAWLVDRLDARGARDIREPAEIVLARRVV